MSNFVNSIAVFLIGRLGLNLQGARIVTVRGRTSGQPRSLVVNPLELDGATYLFSPRGETNWVKNARAAGEVSLHRGGEQASFQVREVVDHDEKLVVMRAYLDRWSWQVKSIMGVDKSSTDDALHAIMEKHPVFALSRR